MRPISNTTIILALLITIGLPVNGHAGDPYSYESIRDEYAVTDCSSTERDHARDGCVPEGPLKLDDAIAVALANNPDSQMALARIEKARAMLDQTEAAFYPALSFYTEYLQGDAPSAYLFKTIDQRQLAPGTDFNDPGWFQNYETGVQGRINLFNGGKDMMNRRIAKRGVEISQLDRQVVANSLVAAVISSYFDYLSAADFVAIAENSLETVASQLKVMQVRYDAGGALKSDILSLEVRMAQAKEDVVRSKNRLRLSMAAFANVLGISPDSDFHIETGESAPVDIPADYDAAINLALERRPELKKAREQLKQSRMAVDAAQSGYWPTLDLLGKYYHDDPSFDYDGDRQNWTVGAMLNWYFFTGFSTRSDSRIATAQIHEALAADRKTALGIRLDVKNAYLKMEEAEARLRVTEKSVDSAEESLILVKKQFEGGSATVTRYLEAELARNAARIRSTTAYFDREKAIADAGRAVGLWTASASPEAGERSGSEADVPPESQ